MSDYVMYSGDGKGGWWRTEWQPQCPEMAYFNGKCQGTTGHKGVHWCYGDDGSFQWSVNDNEPHEDDIACGSTPPDHKSYKTPMAMAKFHHLRFKKTDKVRDRAIIAKLEKGQPPEKNASINAPLDFSKLSPEFRKRLLSRIPKK
jgi:tRNA (cmo5U34)-methyltransferase